jgi:tetratricopeptide (TPR) repeat protein
MQVNPADGRPRMMRWRVLRRLGDEEKAKAEIQQVVTRLGPKWIELVAWQLSQFQWEYGAAEDVVGLLQETQGIVPESGKIHLYLSMAYLKEADAADEERLLHLDLAQSELEKAERLLPRDPEVLTVRVKLAQMQQSLP